MKKSKTRRERTILQKLMEITTEQKAKFICWKYKILYKNDTFEQFSKKYLNGADEDTANTYLYEEEVQKAIKTLLKILHNKKLIELYDIYFKRAKEDTQAFKAFMEFSDKFFADEKESELTSILNGVDVGDNND